MRRISMKDVVAGVALSAAVGLPIAAIGAVSQREIANRVNCAKNLRQLGMALMLYANENRGKYPRTAYQRDAQPVWGTPYESDRTLDADPNANPFATGKLRPADNDVTAALFLLLRTQEIKTEAFVCPGSGLKPLQFPKDASAANFTNWKGKDDLAAHLSYSYANPYPSTAALQAGYKLDNTLTAEFAVMSDMNPGVEALTTTDFRAATVTMQKVNPLNHQGEGLNVLFGDGHIEFTTSPFVGVQRDNIFTANGPEVPGRPNAKATLGGSPADANDSILLPTAAEIGQKISPPNEAELARQEAADAAKAVDLAKQARGTWSREAAPGRVVKLTITDDAITANSGAVTINFGYKAVGLHEGNVILQLLAPDTAPIDALLLVTPDGKLQFDAREGDATSLRGEWLKGVRPATRRALPASRPF